MSGHYSGVRLRRGVAHFLWGKASSAALSFFGFLLVARLLSTADYGRYVALVAVVELALSLSTLGLDWVATRYVPEYRVKAGGRGMSSFVLRLTLIQGGVLVCASSMLALAADPLARLLGLGAAQEAVRLYALYLLLEGLSRVVRDQMLSQLLLQGRAQLALVLRHSVWVGLCLVLLMQNPVAPLQLVAWIEVLAAGLGFLVAGLGLAVALLKARRETGAADANWLPPAMDELRKLAFNSYSSYLMNMAARPQLVTLLITRLAGVEAAALFGFARNLSDQVLRFLPAELLLGFLRPALIARYVETKDQVALNQQINSLLTVSLLVLAPLLALALGQGSLLVAVLGDGRFEGSAVLLTLLLLTVALFSHRRVVEFTAYTVGRPEAVGRASFFMLLVPAFVYAMLSAGWPMWSVPAVLLLAEFSFSVMATLWLRRGGVAYAPPFREVLRIAVMLAGAASVAAFVPVPFHGLAALVAHFVLSLLGFVLLGFLLKPLDRQSISMLKALRKKGT